MDLQEKIQAVLAICEGMTGKELGQVMQALSIEWEKVAPPMRPPGGPPSPQQFLDQVMPEVIAGLPPELRANMDKEGDVENTRREVQ